MQFIVVNDHELLQMLVSSVPECGLLRAVEHIISDWKGQPTPTNTYGDRNRTNNFLFFAKC